MAFSGRSAAADGFMARLLGAAGASSGRRIATIACIAALVGVALIGTVPSLAGGAQPGATGASASSSAWSSGDPTGLNWPDLVTKGLIVLVLLFITLRVLGKVGNGTTKRGGRLEVLESRTLAPKASLHLVAIGDRRLVVGLTPSGMVSLAELDATELAEADEITSTAGGTATDPGELGGAARPAIPTLGTALNSMLAPLDALTGRLATFVSGGRVR